MPTKTNAGIGSEDCLFAYSTKRGAFYAIDATGMDLKIFLPESSTVRDLKIAVAKRMKKQWFGKDAWGEEDEDETEKKADGGADEGGGGEENDDDDPFASAFDDYETDEEKEEVGKADIANDKAGCNIPPKLLDELVVIYHTPYTKAAAERSPPLEVWTLPAGSLLSPGSKENSFNYEEWLRTSLKPGDAKIFAKEYLQDEVPALTDMMLIEKDDLREGVSNVLARNRIWKAVEDLKATTGQGESQLYCAAKVESGGDKGKFFAKLFGRGRSSIGHEAYRNSSFIINEEALEGAQCGENAAPSDTKISVFRKMEIAIEVRGNKDDGDGGQGRGQEGTLGVVKLHTTSRLSDLYEEVLQEGWGGAQVDAKDGLLNFALVLQSNDGSTASRSPIVLDPWGYIGDIWTSLCEGQGASVKIVLLNNRITTSRLGHPCCTKSMENGMIVVDLANGKKPSEENKLVVRLENDAFGEASEDTTFLAYVNDDTTGDELAEAIGLTPKSSVCLSAVFADQKLKTERVSKRYASGSIKGYIKDRAESGSQVFHHIRAMKSSSSDLSQVTVKTLTGKSIILDVCGADTVSMLKQKVGSIFTEKLGE